LEKKNQKFFFIFEEKKKFFLVVKNTVFWSDFGTSDARSHELWSRPGNKCRCR
jgi:hypothetical protein